MPTSPVYPTQWITIDRKDDACANRSDHADIVLTVKTEGAVSRETYVADISSDLYCLVNAMIYRQKPMRRRMPAKLDTSKTAYIRRSRGVSYPHTSIESVPDGVPDPIYREIWIAGKAVPVVFLQVSARMYRQRAIYRSPL